MLRASAAIMLFGWPQEALGHSLRRSRQVPGVETGDGYEYGDREANARNEDSSDYSVHQFIAVDDARDGPQSTGDDAADAKAAIRRSTELASDDHFNSENTPSTDDDFLQLKQVPGVETGDGYEYGDREANARNEDSSDYSVHQFIAVDDARDGPQSTGDDAAAAKAAIHRSTELASDDHFNSENPPAADDEDFIQLKSKTRSKRQIPTVDTGDGYEYGDREAL